MLGSRRSGKVLGAAILGLVLIADLGAAGASSAAGDRTLSLAAAVTVIRTVPTSPPADAPFKGPYSDTHDSLRRMLRNPGNCLDVVPPAGCHRWSAGIREVRVDGIRERAFVGRHDDVTATAYVFHEQAGATAAFAIIKAMWTQGVFRLQPFAVRGLGVEGTGLSGSLDVSGDTYSTGYLWRFENVVFEVFLSAPNGTLPPLSTQRKLTAAFRSYADAVQRRAMSLA